MEAALEPPQHRGGGDKADGEEEEPATGPGEDGRTGERTDVVQHVRRNADDGTPPRGQGLAHSGTGPAAGVHRFESY